MKIPIVSHKDIVFMRVYVVIVILFASTQWCYAQQRQSNSSIKSMIVQEIMKKVSNITLNSLSKAPAEKKQLILNKIESKLRKSARSMGPDANKYVKFIMEEFKTKAFAKKVKNVSKGKNVSQVLRKSVPLKAIKDNSSTHVIDPKTKQEIIKEISNKIHSLAKGFLKSAKTIEHKKEILEKIKNRIMDSAKQKHIQIHNKHEELKAYSSLIAQGLEVSIKKLLADDAKARRMESKEDIKLKTVADRYKNHDNRMKIFPKVHSKSHSELGSNLGSQVDSNLDSQVDTKGDSRVKSKVNSYSDSAVDVKVISKVDSGADSETDLKVESKVDDSKHESVGEEDLLKKTMIVIDIQEIDKYKDLIAKSIKDSSVDPHCDEIVEETCLNIQSFNKIQCQDGKSVGIENLCNGVIDCWNQVDEVNCTAQAMDKVRKANAVMTDIEASLNRKCFATSMDGNLLTSQNQILRDVLLSQMDFLEKNVKAPLIATIRKPADDLFIKKAVNDVAVVLNTLSYALDGTLCAHRIDPDRRGNSHARKYNDIEMEDIDDIPRNPTWSPKSCICKEQFCDDVHCEAPCKRVCWQKYSLSHWGCQAINGGTSVNLTALCDGKIDCFDETDESHCSTDDKQSKFESSSTYSNLIDLLETKSKSFDFHIARNKLVTISSLVRQLQKHTMKSNIDTHKILSLRDEAFNLLTSIYEDLMQTAGLQELDDAYLILLSINEKLVTALKLSHTGNENLISPEGCYCRDGLCALRRCNKNCIQACLAEPILTRFSCNTQNITVPIETICNGKKNCPNGEDEKDCIKDICRGHHLVVLRHKLQNVAVNHQGTVLGEVLDTWKTKVSASLFIAESAGRPNHEVMIEIVARVLHDLVTAFAAMEDYRRTNSQFALQTFVGVSKIVQNALKSCLN